VTNWTNISALATGFSRFLLRPGREDAWLLSVTRHWNVDRPDPR